MKALPIWVEGLVDDFVDSRGHRTVYAAFPMNGKTDTKSKLKKVIAELRAKDIPWSKIIPALSQILMIVLSGGTIGWPQLIAAILAIFEQPAPTPIPTPTV